MLTPIIPRDSTVIFSYFKSVNSTVFFKATVWTSIELVSLFIIQDIFIEKVHQTYPLQNLTTHTMLIVGGLKGMTVVLGAWCLNKVAGLVLPFPVIIVLAAITKTCIAKYKDVKSDQIKDGKNDVNLDQTKDVRLDQINELKAKLELVKIDSETNGGIEDKDLRVYKSSCEALCQAFMGKSLNQFDQHYKQQINFIEYNWQVAQKSGGYSDLEIALINTKRILNSIKLKAEEDCFDFGDEDNL